MHSGIIDSCSSAEGIDGSLPGLIVFPLNHLVDLPKLIINLFEDYFVLIIQHFLILIHLNINMFDPF